MNRRLVMVLRVASLVGMVLAQVFARLDAPFLRPWDASFLEQFSAWFFGVFTTAMLFPIASGKTVAAMEKIVGVLCSGFVLLGLIAFILVRWIGD